jgi:peptide/nickel transport system ATP-binding protein
LCFKRLNLLLPLWLSPYFPFKISKSSKKRRGLFRCYQKHQLWFATQWNPRNWESGSGKSVSFSYYICCLPIFREFQQVDCFDSKNVGHLSEKNCKTQRKPNRDDFPRTDEFTESVTEVWFSGAGNSVATQIIHSRDQKWDTFAIRKVKLPNPEILFDKYPHEISGDKNNASWLLWRLLANHNCWIAWTYNSLRRYSSKEIIQLLKDSARNGNEYYFITWFVVVSEIAHRVLVMYQGKLWSRGSKTNYKSGT